MTMMKHKRFSSRIEVRNGRFWWTQVKANVDDHVLETQVTVEESREKDFVLNYTAETIMQKPFDRSKPLWDIHLLEAPLGNAQSCAVIRIHHSLGDGTSLLSLLMASSREIGKPDVLPSLPTVSKTGSLSQEKAPSFFTRLLVLICNLCLIFWYSLTEIGKFIGLVLWVKDSNTPIKGNSDCGLMPKKYRYVTVSLEDLKYVSKAVGGTINDAFVAMTASGLRKYMENGLRRDATGKGSHDENAMKQSDVKADEEKRRELNPTAEAEQFSKLERLRIRALALINIRRTPGLPELADMMSGSASQARWGNHMGYLLLQMPLKRGYENPLDLVRDVMVIGNRKKLSLEGPFTYASGNLVMSLFGEKIASKVLYRSIVHTTLSVSNVKGPEQEVMFAENPITHIIPSVFGHPHALCVHLQSYNGQLFLVAMVAKDVVPDPEIFLKFCVEALEEFKEAARRVPESKVL